MMPRPLLPVLLCAVLALTSAKSSSQEPCNTPYIASDVTLSTASDVPRDVTAATKAALIGQCFQGPTDANLVASVQQVLRDMGYLRANVAAPSMTLSNASSDPQRAALTFTVHEGSRSPVQEIEIAGNNLIEADQIRTVTQVQLGEFLDMSKVRASALTIQKLYRANGFFKTSVKEGIEFSRAPMVRVVFQINEGPRS
jgi:hemolysin activation/secretion protein